MIARLSFPKPPIVGGYRLGLEDFRSKAAVKRRARQILGGHPRGSRITDPSEVAFLSDLVARNLEASYKLVGQIIGFIVEKAPDHATKCFYVLQQGLPPVHFGIEACLTSFWSLNLKSFRSIVQEDADAFRDGRLAGAATFISDFSGRKAPVSECEVDHEPPQTFEVWLEPFVSRMAIA